MNIIVPVPVVILLLVVFGHGAYPVRRDLAVVPGLGRRPRLDREKSRLRGVARCRSAGHALGLVAMVLLVLDVGLHVVVRLLALVARRRLRFENIHFGQQLHQHVLNPAEVVGPLSAQPLQRAAENALLLGVQSVVDGTGLRAAMDRARSAARIGARAIDGALDRLLGVLLDLGDDDVFGVREQPLDILKVVAHLGRGADKRHKDLRVACTALGIAHHQLRQG